MKLITADNLDQVLFSHVENMRRAGLCYSKQESLVEAVKAREEDGKDD